MQLKNISVVDIFLYAQIRLSYCEILFTWRRFERNCSRIIVAVRACLQTAYLMMRQAVFLFREGKVRAAEQGTHRFSRQPEREDEKMFVVPAIDMVATGKNIARLREAAGLTVKDLQAIFGFATPQAIYKWQHGTAMPTIDNLVVLAAVLEVTMDEIVVIDAELSGQISA